MDVIRQKVAEILLDAGAVTLRPEQPFTWASGIRSPIYCDNRLLMSDVNARREVREAFCHMMKEKGLICELVAGVATGAIPHAAWVAERLGKPFVYVRLEAKGHGKQNRLEGKAAPGAETILIEDLVSTGASSAAAIEALREAGVKVGHCLAIFSYGFGEAAEKFAAAQCTLTPLTDFLTLLQIAKEKRIIKAEQVEILKKFSADPWNWLK